MIGLIQASFRFVLKVLGGSKPKPVRVKVRRPFVIVRRKRLLLRK